MNPRDRVAPKEFGRRFLRSLFDAALAAADPYRAIAPAMPAAALYTVLGNRAGLAAGDYTVTVADRSPGALAKLEAQGIKTRGLDVTDSAALADAMKGRFARTPKLSDVPYPVQMEPNLVVEFYSR